MRTLTRKEILKFFIYDKERGVLIWRHHWSKSHVTRFVGKEVTSESEREGLRYIRVRLKDQLFLVHRIIWFLEKNDWPDLIDHIDGNGRNNRIENLRVATKRQNMQNMRKHRSGHLLGTSLLCDRYNDPRWLSKIKIGKEYRRLGRYYTQQEAHVRYLQELKKLGFSL